MTALLLGNASCSFVKEHVNYIESERAFYRSSSIFQPGEFGKECHSSTIVELANGDIVAAWWCGSYEGANDVVIKASRFRQGENSWETAKTVADITDRFEGNPVLFSFPDGIVRLFFVTVDPSLPGIVQIMFCESTDLGHSWGRIEKFVTRPGIRTKNHLIIMENGKLLFPLFDQITSQSVFLISGDFGRTWELSNPIVSDPGNVQPTVISRSNGTLYTLMRSWNEDPAKRYLWQSESEDFGRTWSRATYSSIPSVSSAAEMIRLRNGHVVLAYNDGKERKRTPLTVALSFDEGRSWSYKRNLESGPGSFSYPSLVQTRDGHIQITYSYNRRFIKHVEVNEEWIRYGD